MGNQGQVIGDRDGGDQEIIGADWGALKFKFSANTACKITRNVVEGKTGEWLEKLFDKLAVAIGLLAFVCSVAKFGIND